MFKVSKTCITVNVDLTWLHQLHFVLIDYHIAGHQDTCHQTTQITCVQINLTDVISKQPALTSLTTTNQRLVWAWIVGPVVSEVWCNKTKLRSKSDAKHFFACQVCFGFDFQIRGTRLASPFWHVLIQRSHVVREELALVWRSEMCDQSKLTKLTLTHRLGYVSLNLNAPCGHNTRHATQLALGSEYVRVYV